MCMCEWPDGCGGGGTLRCRGCGGDLCVCICRGERDCDGCEDCDFGDHDEGYDAEEYDPEEAEREAERWTCIGADCCNPHVIHTRDECFTTEMAEAAMTEREEP